VTTVTGKSYWARAAVVLDIRGDAQDAYFDVEVNKVVRDEDNNTIPRQRRHTHIVYALVSAPNKTIAAGNAELAKHISATAALSLLPQSIAVLPA
jgi:hypothetical protein